MSKELNVLVLQTWLDYRGAEMQSYQLTEDLHKRGHRVSLLCLYVTSAVQDHIDSTLIIRPPLIVEKLLRNKYFFFLFGFWIMLAMLIRVGNTYDAYNPHNFPSVWCAVIVGFFYKKKVAWTVHNYPQHPFVGLSAKFYELFSRPLDQLLVSRVAIAVAVSRKVKQQTKQKYRVATTYIYPGIDIDLYSKVHIPAIDLAFLNGKRVLLHVGRIIPSKGQQTSVDIFSLVAERFPELIIVFIGKGDSSFLHIPDKVRGRVFFVGQQNRDDMGFWYAKADVLLSPYYLTEGCTAVPLEGAVQGCFPIVSANSGVDEILDRDHFGLVFEPNGELSGVVDQIGRVLTKPRSDYKQIISRYSRQVFAEEYEKVFRNLLGGDYKEGV